MPKCTAFKQLGIGWILFTLTVFIGYGLYNDFVSWDQLMIAYANAIGFFIGQKAQRKS